MVSTRTTKAARARFIVIACIAALSASAEAHAGVNSWTSLGPEAGGATVLAIDPHAAQTIYAGGCNGTSGGVYKTTDGGTSGTAVNSGLPSGIFGICVVA